MCTSVFPWRSLTLSLTGGAGFPVARICRCRFEVDQWTGLCAPDFTLHCYLLCSCFICGLRDLEFPLPFLFFPLSVNSALNLLDFFLVKIWLRWPQDCLSSKWNLEFWWLQDFRWLQKSLRVNIDVRSMFFSQSSPYKNCKLINWDDSL